MLQQVVIRVFCRDPTILVRGYATTVVSPSFPLATGDFPRRTRMPPSPADSGWLQLRFLRSVLWHRGHTG